jgi:hypothetical protein
VADGGNDALVRDLAALGRAADVPAPFDALTTVVMERVAPLPAPSPRVGRATRLRRLVADGMESRRRRTALVVGAVLLALLAAPPVRAAVADWLGFGGVLVERGSHQPGPAAPPPAVTQDRSLSEAAAAVEFIVSVPEELGVPDGVEVSSGRRVVSMSWTTDEAGVLRLDQFGARLDFAVAKRAPEVYYAAVDGSDALWFEEPHEVALLEPDGSRVTRSARLAGHTLIWQDGSTTLRLEGELSLDRAVDIAESTVAVG